VELLLIYVAIIGAVMLFMTSRGRKKQQAQQLMMRDALAVGVEARTIGGLVGEVVELTDEHVILETTPGVKLKFVKTAIAGVVPPETEDETEEMVSELGSDEDEDGEADEATETGESAELGVHDSVVAEAEKVVEAAAAESTESSKK
jgi:preprotein translocase subunit YajC